MARLSPDDLQILASRALGVGDGIMTTPESDKEAALNELFGFNKSSSLLDRISSLLTPPGTHNTAPQMTMQEFENQIPTEDAVPQETAKPVAQQGSESPQSSFKLSGGDTFQNTHGTYSKTANNASKRFADFLKGVSEQKQRDLIATANSTATKLGKTNDPDNAPRIASLLHGVAEVNASNAKDNTGMLDAHLKILQSDKLQKEIDNMGEKDFTQFLDNSVKEFALAPDDRTRIEQARARGADKNSILQLMVDAVNAKAKKSGKKSDIQDLLTDRTNNG